MPYIKLEDLQKIPIRIDHYDEENGNINFVLGIETAIEYAESLPTADVVEVVRCKDCKYGTIPFNGYAGENRRHCNRIGKDVSVPANFYCGFGERKK